MSGSAAGPRRRGLLIDFGGVLTTNVFGSFTAFCAAEGLEPDTVARRFREDPAARDLLGELEEGRIAVAQFEPRFAELLGIPHHAGLVDRLFAGMRPDHEMVDAVARAKGAGVRTALVSNSWGPERYDRRRFPELFDAVVISGEEGVRKPAPEIYALGAERIGLPPTACVFVDDLPGNLKPARAMGMATVRHRSAPETIAELEELLGVPLR